MSADTCINILDCPRAGDGVTTDLSRDHPLCPQHGRPRVQLRLDVPLHPLPRLRLFQGSEDKECQGISSTHQTNKSRNLRTEKLCNFTDQEYVHWMTYWIVLAVVSVGEEVTDIVLAPWFPFYYELKIVFLLWLISPVSRYLHP